MKSALLIEDDPQGLEALEIWADSENLQARTAGSLSEARKAVRKKLPELVLLDVGLPDGSGLDLLEELGHRTTVIVVSGLPSVTEAEARNRGASCYLPKPIDPERLTALLRRPQHRLSPREFLGQSEAIENVRRRVHRVAQSDTPVFLYGETGVGKEMVARLLHWESGRRKYEVVNCAAIPQSLAEAELFGHRRGSFTGAIRDHKGVLERAGSGTLFLDEISEMPAMLQPKLLRVIEKGEFSRVGGETVRSTTARVVAATNRSLQELLLPESSFRIDLLHRLTAFPIHIPPLRARTGDIRLLAAHFIEALSVDTSAVRTLTEEAIERLEDHPWPGNVRELKNTLHRAFLLADDEIRGEHIEFLPLAPGQRVASDRKDKKLAEVEREHILATLHAHQDDRRRTARALGISRKTLYNRLKSYGSTDA